MSIYHRTSRGTCISFENWLTDLITGVGKMRERWKLAVITSQQRIVAMAFSLSYFSFTSVFVKSYCIYGYSYTLAVARECSPWPCIVWILMGWWGKNEKWFAYRYEWGWFAYAFAHEFNLFVCIHSTIMFTYINSVTSWNRRNRRNFSFIAS